MTHTYDAAVLAELVTDGPDGEPVMGHPMRYRVHPAGRGAVVPELVDGLTTELWS